MIDISSQKPVAGGNGTGQVTALYDATQLELKAMPALRTAFNHWYHCAHLGFAHSPWKNASSCSKSTPRLSPRSSAASSPKSSPISPNAVQNCQPPPRKEAPRATSQPTPSARPARSKRYLTPHPGILRFFSVRLRWRRLP